MKSALPAEKANTAFARYYSAPESLELRKAIQICKSVPAPLLDVQPMQNWRCRRYQQRRGSI